MKITNIDLNLLAVFDSVVRNGGFSAAQLELGLSQPTISNHIKALEERLGVKLCQRGRRGFMLTEKGQIVHELNQSLVAELDLHASKLAELKGSLVGRLKIAVVDCLVSDPCFLLPQAIEAYSKLAPAVQLELTIERPQDILTGLLDGSFHVGVGGFDNFLSGLDYATLYREHHALYCSDPHPLFKKLTTDDDEVDFCDFAWVHRRYWNKQRQRGRSFSESDVFVQEIEAQIMMILSGIYLGLLPEHAALPHVESGRLRQVPFCDPNQDVPIDVVTSLKTLPSTIRQFRNLLLAQYTND